MNIQYVDTENLLNRCIKEAKSWLEDLLQIDDSKLKSQYHFRIFHLVGFIEENLNIIIDNASYLQDCEIPPDTPEKYANCYYSAQELLKEDREFLGKNISRDDNKILNLKHDAIPDKHDVFKSGPTLERVRFHEYSRMHQPHMRWLYDYFVKLLKLKEDVQQGIISRESFITGWGEVERGISGIKNCDEQEIDFLRWVQSKIWIEFKYRCGEEN